jgi:spore maturation protein CgeB
MPERTFVLAGSMYDASFPWRENVHHVRHLEPALHPSFLCSSPLTVNVTRPELAALGHCPSPRLFEAAACGVPVLSDWFDGLDAFFEPGEEIIVARSVEEAAEGVATPREELAWIGRRARDRALAEHGADARARQLVAFCEAAARGAGLERPPGDVLAGGEDDAQVDRDLERDVDWEYGPVHGSASERGPDDDRDHEHRWTIERRGDGA